MAQCLYEWDMPKDPSKSTKKYLLWNCKSLKMVQKYCQYLQGKTAL